MAVVEHVPRILPDLQVEWVVFCCVGTEFVFFAGVSIDMTSETTTTLVQDYCARSFLQVLVLQLLLLLAVIEQGLKSHQLELTNTSAIPVLQK